MKDLKIGAFGFAENADGVKAAGYDYIELDLPELATMEEEQFAVFADHLREIRLPALSGARILPASEPLIFEPGFSAKSWEAFLEREVERAAVLGMEKIIFGNGKARLRPDGAREECFSDFLRMICDLCRAKGIRLVLEPLSPRYSNYINTLSQAAAVWEKVGRANFGIMADLRHMVGSADPYEDILRFQEIIDHFHLDYPLSYPERRVPKKTDGFDYRPFIEAVQRVERCSTVTVESDIPQNWAEAFRCEREVLEMCI